MASTQDETIADSQRVIAALQQQLDEREVERDAALAQKAALAEILDAINRSSRDPRPVFDAILERAMRLCEAAFGFLATYDGEHFKPAALRGVPDVLADYLGTGMDQPRPGDAHWRLLAGEELVHNLDQMDEDAYRSGSPLRRAIVDLGGARSALVVALRKDGVLLGALTIYRKEVRPFSNKQIALLQNFAAQAVIAMENARLISEQREALEQQTATAEVLQVINASPGNLTPVFDAMLGKATGLCEAPCGLLAIYDGEFFRYVAVHGEAGFVEEQLKRGPLTPSAGVTWPAIVAGESTIHLPDVRDTEPYHTGHDGARKFVDGGVGRTLLSVALRKDEVLLGVLTIYRKEARPFTDKQIALLQNFASQAVIAIENARLIIEQREALEQQTATAEVLQVINSSPGNLAPVFDAMLEKAMRLCGASFGILRIIEDGRFYSAASRGVPAAYAEFLAHNPQVAQPGSTGARILDGEPLVHVVDVADDKVYQSTDTHRRALVELGGARTSLVASLKKESLVLRAIQLYRQNVQAFTDKQIVLLQIFAAQAGIAIENARLWTETREALEQQTATAAVLQVINNSPGDLGPVFDVILDKAQRVCGVDHAALELYDGERMHAISVHGASDGFAKTLRHGYRASDSPASQALLEGQPFIQIADASQVDHVAIQTAAAVDEIGTVLFVPLRRGTGLLGMIASARRKIHPFSVKDIALLQNFAAQAVIAIENARLLVETREALEQQTATAEVLQAINASPGDLAPVFEAMLEKAMHLCGAAFGSLYTFDGDRFQSVAQCGVPVAYAEFRAKNPPNLAGHAALMRIIETKRPIQVLDMMTVEAYKAGNPGVLAMVDLGGVRTILTVPLLKDGAVQGIITVYRQEVRQFSDKQIALLETFAAQAVIAVENARLLSDLQERTAALAQRNSEFGERIGQQSATIDVLKVMSRSPDDTQPVFDLIVGRALELCKGWGATLCEFDGTLVHLRALCGPWDPTTLTAYVAAHPMAPTRGSITCRAILDKQVIHIRDIDAEPGILQIMRNIGWKSNLSLPLLRDGVAIGALSLTSQELGGFSDSQVALLQTFAEQAVIAITSVATFRQLQERTGELSRSVAELQSLEEVLRAVNSSLDLDTVLATIISRAVQLSQADEGTIYEFNEAEKVFVPRSAYGMTEDRVAALRERKIRLGETHLGRAALLRAPVHVADVQQDTVIADAGGLLRGIHAVLAVPLLRDEKVVGGLVIRRRTVGGFAPSIPTLLQTFAGQAVLAIENAELFQEARRAHIAAELALTDLRRTQDRLVQSQKMASLGQLTAGIAHEIKNPLNFVNNFSDLSVDLLSELQEAVAPEKLTVADSMRTEIDDITSTLKGNLEKIAQHGRRADSIVKNMLLHSRTGPSEHRAIDLNTTIEEALNLAYHGARAETLGFDITMEKDFDPKAGAIDAFPQEFLRVMLNLISNGFYAARKRACETTDPGFKPTIRLTTHDLGEQVEIRVRDNGSGMTDAVRNKIFEPFFTTKPAGEGTGLGLSLSYDIVVKQHGGTITVDSQIGEYTEFIVTLPRRMFANDGGRV